MPRRAASGRRIELIAPGGFPLIAPGDDLVDAIMGALTTERIALRDGDILVLAQKVVSKAEGRYVDLCGVTPSPRARNWPRSAARMRGSSRQSCRNRPK